MKINNKEKRVHFFEKILPKKFAGFGKCCTFAASKDKEITLKIIET